MIDISCIFHGIRTKHTWILLFNPMGNLCRWNIFEIYVSMYITCYHMPRCKSVNLSTCKEDSRFRKKTHGLDSFRSCGKYQMIQTNYYLYLTASKHIKQLAMSVLKHINNIVPLFRARIEAYSLAKFEINMQVLCSLHEKIKGYLQDDVDKEYWSRVHFNEI